MVLNWVTSLTDVRRSNCVLLILWFPASHDTLRARGGGGGGGGFSCLKSSYFVVSCISRYFESGGGGGGVFSCFKIFLFCGFLHLTMLWGGGGGGGRGGLCLFCGSGFLVNYWCLLPSQPGMVTSRLCSHISLLRHCAYMFGDKQAARQPNSQAEEERLIFHFLRNEILGRTLGLPICSCLSPVQTEIYLMSSTY